jgi:predicted transcriptional regulator
MDSASALRRARRRAGATQRGLAARAGVPQPAIARIERGSVVPRVDTLERLLRACGETLEAMPEIGIGIDRSRIAELLELSPAERLRVAVEEARNMQRLLS